MKTTNILLIIAFICGTALILLHNKLSSNVGNNFWRRERSLDNILSIVHSQNETISIMNKLLHNNPKLSQLFETLKGKDEEINALKQQISKFSSISLNSTKKLSIQKDIHLSVKEDDLNNNVIIPPPTPFQTECESRYGMTLVKLWRKSEQTWCTTTSEAPLQSALKCYPYRQKHKRAEDMFCVATNFFIDFAKVL